MFTLPRIFVSLVALIAVAPPLGGMVAHANDSYGFGKPATADDIVAAEVDVRFDGLGLPQGEGSAEDGQKTYQTKCASCHGATLEGNKALYIKPLIGEARHAINQQPFAPPIFAYIRRAMPLTQPGSLSNDEVYGLLAFLLRETGIVKGANPTLDADSLSKIDMPNRDNFFPAAASGLSLPTRN